MQFTQCIGARFSLFLRPIPVLDLKQSLEEIREMWTRLLALAAGSVVGSSTHASSTKVGSSSLLSSCSCCVCHGLDDAAIGNGCEAPDI